MCLHCLARHVPGPGTVWQAADRQLLDPGHTEHQTLTYTYLHWALDTDKMWIVINIPGCVLPAILLH